MSALTARRVLTGGLAVIAGLIGSQLAAPVEASAAPVETTVADGNFGPSQLTLKGQWATRSTPANLSKKSASLASTGSAELAFRSTGISWITATNNYSGIAVVYVDGVKKKTVDLYSSTTKNQQVVYKASGLRNGPHILKVVRTGNKNARSTGRNLTVDAFSVLDITAPMAPMALTNRLTAQGTTLDWTGSTSADVAGYRVYRQHGTGSKALLGTTAGTVTKLADAGLADDTTYTYTLVAFDRAGNTSQPAVVRVNTPAAAAPSRYRFANCPEATVRVANRSELVAALAEAGPGTAIRLSAGRYWGTTVTVKGTEEQPIWICGSRDVVFDQGNPSAGVGLRIQSSSHVVVAGMTVRNTAKGVMVIGSDHVTVADLKIENTGEEAVHIRGFTTDSTVVGNTINTTGLVHPQWGEGIYIGTDKGSWCTYNDCLPDRTVRNTIVGNTITNMTSEGIEAKEATADTLISGNTIDGANTTEANASGTLIKVKGNRFTILDNKLSNSTLDAVLILKTLDDTGQDNVAFRNQFSGRIPGYGVRVANKSTDAMVGCDNVGPTGLGKSNRTCHI